MMTANTTGVTNTLASIMNGRGARQRINSAMASISIVEDIAKSLGIEDVSSMPDEFWETQGHAARHRFYWMCLEQVGLPLSTDRDELYSENECAIADIAERFLAQPGFSYAEVRAWYKNYGEFAVDKAFKLCREQSDIKAHRLYVLFIFDKGAKCLQYDNDRQPTLVDRDNAFHFHVESLSQMQKPYLIDMAKHFESIAKNFGAKQVKVLCLKV